MPNLITVKNAFVIQSSQTVFEDLNFEWNQGQHWAIVGSSGNELSQFIQTLLGRTMLSAGTITRPFAAAHQQEKIIAGEVFSYRDLTASVSQNYTFRNISNLQNFYYQQRFNSQESEDTYNVRTYLENQVSNSGYWKVSNVIEFMGLALLADKSLIKLSNGETRRLAIASALLKNPVLLLLDQPTTGLDVGTRRDFDKILSKIIKSGIHILLTAHSNEISSCMTHVAELGNKKIQQFYPKNSKPKVEVQKSELVSFDKNELAKLVRNYKLISNESVLKLAEVTIRYGEKTILDKVNWEIKDGEKWALKGKNGAGKSTLLSLILAENPQAYANDIWLFGKKRGSGESIWEIKKQIGFVAPELARLFPINQTCLKVVLSGLFDTMGLFKKVSKEQEGLAQAWLKLIRLEQYVQTPFNQISLEAKRFVLLARALIKHPRLLVLDEASQGMDEFQRVLFKDTLNLICEITPITLIYVSHYEEDIPDCVDKVLEL